MGQFYSKINTLYKRHEDGPFKHCIIPGDFSDPETELLKDLKWKWYEKIDGTNMSYSLYKNEFGDFVFNIHGKTPNANIPEHLQKKMFSLLDKEKMLKYFSDKGTLIGDDVSIEIFGEGYGMKIQKGGNYIKNDVDFIVFDVKINGWWLKQEDVDEIAAGLGLKRVPYIGEMTIAEAEEYVKKGFKSNIAENKDYDAEGLVGHAPMDLRKRNGDRILVKIKTCDYRDLERKQFNELANLNSPQKK